MAGISAGEAWNAAASALRARMVELGLTQFELASKSGVSTGTITEMLHARPRQRSPRTMAAVSKALGWPSGRLAAIVQGQREAERGPAGISPDAEPDTGAELKAIRDELGRLSRRLDALESQQAATGQ